MHHHLQADYHCHRYRKRGLAAAPGAKAQSARRAREGKPTEQQRQGIACGQWLLVGDRHAKVYFTFEAAAQPYSLSPSSNANWFDSSPTILCT
jgi:hypothetical protein